MATIDDVKAWLNDPASGSEVYGRNWSGLCQAFAWQVCNAFGSAPVGYLSAYSAFEHSTIESTDPNAAPAGSFHYWEIAMPDGHVAVGLGDGMCMMASSKVTDMWATNVGEISVDEYTAKVGGHYLGWSNSNGSNTANITTAMDITLGLSEPAQFGVQRALTDLHYYTGAINGVFDAASIAAWQRYLTDEKVLPADYVADGVPGPLLKQAVHTVAQAYKPGEADSEGVYQWATNVVNTTEKPTAPPVVKPQPAPAPEPTSNGDTSLTPIPAPAAQPVTPAAPAKPMPTDEQIQKLIAIADVQTLDDPNAPVIPDTVAKPLWLVLALISSSTPYAFALTVVPWAAWDANIATQAAAIIVAWSGTLASVLGLSRFSKSSAK